MTVKQRDQLLADDDRRGRGSWCCATTSCRSRRSRSPRRIRAQLLDSQAGFIRRLEASGRLNRELEVLPDEETLAQRRQLGQGLYRPEVAVLLAYAKMTLYDELLASDLPDDPYLLRRSGQVFPAPAAQALRPQIERHRLRREIIATLVANSLVNRGLGEFVGELSEQTGRTPAAIARAYIVARDAFGLVPLFGQGISGVRSLSGLHGSEAARAA